METEEAAPKPNKPTFQFKVQIGNRLFKGRLDIDFLNAPFEGLKFLLPGGEEGVETAEIKLESVELSERKKKLQQLTIDGRHVHEVLVGDEIKVHFKARSVGDAMEASLLPKDWKMPEGMTDAWFETYKTARTLASAIVRYGGKSIGETVQEKYDFIMNLPETTFAHLVDEYNAMLAANRDVVKPQVLDAIVPKS